MKRILAAVMLLLAAAVPLKAQRTDFSGLKFCIDPGHDGYDADDRHLVPDPGVNFWESESNFEKALLLKSMLEERGATVILTRYTNNYTPYPDQSVDQVSLAARVETANSNNVDWFHSIHSNAIGNGMQSGTSVNYTLMLVREKRSLTDPAASTGNGLGIPERPESWTMATMMSPAIQAKLRTNSNSTYLDWTFYGGTNGGFSLGVLRGLLMPGELSEGSMHDYAPETRRLLNNDYHKMEMYALRNCFMAYYGLPPDTLGIIAGILTDLAGSAPLNHASIVLSPGGRVYHGDGYNNGFYMFDSLAPGTYTVHFETPGYTPDSVQAVVASGATVFRDRTLQQFGPPAVTSTTPVDGDTAFPASGSITINFSKSMDTASVRSAFSILPSTSGRLLWSHSNSTLTFDPDAILPFYAYFAVTIDTLARSVFGETLDGNGDGAPGDPYAFTFKTTYVDVVPPRIVTRFPDSGAVAAAPGSVINISFDERLNPATVLLSNIVIQQIGGSLLPRTLRYWESGLRSGVDVYLSAPLLAGQSYRMRVSGVSDRVGNVIPNTSPIIWGFSVSPQTYQDVIIDSMNSMGSDWAQPGQSSGTLGIDSARFGFTATYVVPTIAGDAASGGLSYVWDTSAGSWLIVEHLNGGPAQAITWRQENTILQAYVLGDGSMNKIRFAVDDSVDAYPDGRPENREVSRWIPINWVGWKLVSWDFARDSIGAWVGNGILEGLLRFDSFQLGHDPGIGSVSGAVYFDQLQVQEATSSAVSPVAGEIPGTYALDQNYPNPFNPKTVISYQLPVVSNVKLVVYDVLGREVATLVKATQTPGRYRVRFDAAGLASGIYIYRLEAPNVHLSRKMVILK